MGAMNAHRQMGVNATNAGKSMEKLSSGMRINKAGDDAAGLAISEKMRGQIRGLDQAAANAQDGISMIQTAEGGLNETHSILQRMRELAVQASNTTMQDEDRTAVGEEISALKTEIDRIGDNTEFNGKKLLNGDLAVTFDEGTSTLKNSIAIGAAVISDIKVSGATTGTFTFSSANAGELTLTGNGKTQTVSVGAIAALGSDTYNFDQLGISVKANSTAGDSAVNIIAGFGVKTVVTTGTDQATFAIGANAGQNMNVDFVSMKSGDLGTAGLKLSTLITDNTNVSTADKAQTLITSVNDSIINVSAQRAKLGAAQNRLEHTINNLGTSSENLTSAESRIRDVDMAKEMSTFSKNNILSQAAQAMLAQANQQPQQVLQLLR